MKDSEIQRETERERERFKVSIVSIEKNIDKERIHPINKRPYRNKTYNKPVEQHLGMVSFRVVDPDLYLEKKGGSVSVSRIKGRNRIGISKKRSDPDLYLE